jgi:hypothetical protein
VSLIAIIALFLAVPALVRTVADPDRGAVGAPQPVPTADGSPPGSPPQAGGPMQARLDEFVRSCRQSGNYRAGQVVYPRSIDMRVHGTISYFAAVDTADVPTPPRQVIQSDDPAVEGIVVECVVGARLVAVGNGIEVSDASSADGGWQYQAFTPSGLLEWSWSVTATEPKDQQLRLELRPAARDLDSLRLLTAPSAAYQTTVRVEGSVLERGAYWLQTEGNALKVILGGIGAALLAVLAFSQKVRDSIKGLRHPAASDRSSSPDTPEADDPAVTPPSRQGSPPAGKRSRRR